MGEPQKEFGMRLTVDIVSCCSSIRSPLIRIVKPVWQGQLVSNAFFDQPRIGVRAQYLPITLFPVNLGEVLDDVT